MTSIEIVPATKEMVESFRGHNNKTMQVLAAIKDGEVIGLAGLIADKNGLYMFSDITEAVKADKRVVIKAMRKLQEMAKSKNKTIYAVADKNQPTAPSFLKHFGFIETNGVYKMAAAIPALKVIGTVLSVAGSVSQAGAANRRAGEQKAAAFIKSEQYEKKAAKTRAVAQRTAFGEERKAKLVTSRALALMSASGGAVSDPGSTRIIADIENEGAYRQSLAIYEGEETARDYEMASKMALRTGDIQAAESRAKASAYGISAVRSGIAGGTSIYEKYNKPSDNQT